MGEAGFCPHCGSPHTAEDVFCGNCGTRVAEPEAAPGSFEASRQPATDPVPAPTVPMPAYQAPSVPAAAPAYPQPPVGAPPPPRETVEQAMAAAGADAVYYGTRLRGASNAKAKRVFGFRPRRLEWLTP